MILPRFMGLIHQCLHHFSQHQFPINKKPQKEDSDTSTITSSSSQQQPDLKKPKQDSLTSQLKAAPTNTSNLSDSDTDLEETNESLISLKQTFKQLEPHYSTNQSKYPLSFQNFCMFVDMSKGKTNLPALLQDFNLENKIKNLITCIVKSCTFVSHSSTKARLTRLSKRLTNLHQASSKPTV